MNESTKTERPRKPWTVGRILKWALVALVVTPVVLVAGGFGLLAFLQRPLHKPTFFVRLTVDMKVNNEAVQIDRIIECRTFPMGMGDWSASIGKRTRTSHAATVGAIGKSLSDGSAVMMWTPYFCARKKDDATGELVPWEFPEGRLPLMAWTPNADNPQRLEVYPSPVYFKKPYARIRDVNISVRMAPPGARADPPDEFEWFTNKSIRGEDRVTTPIRFVGYTFLTLQENEWRGKSAHLDKVLPSLKGQQILKMVYRIERTQRIYDLQASKTAIEANILFRKHFGPGAGPNQVRGAGMHLFSRPQPSYSHNPAIYPLIDVPTVSSASVADFDGKSISFLNEKRQAFYLLTRIIGNRRNFKKFRTIKIKDYNLEFIRDTGGRIIFDSNSRKLIHLFAVRIKVFPRSGDPFLKKAPDGARGG